MIYGFNENKSKSNLLGFLVEMIEPKLDLSDYEVLDSVDKELYDAIIALGWEDDVLEEE